MTGSTALLARGAYLVLDVRGRLLLRYFGGSWAGHWSPRWCSPRLLLARRGPHVGNVSRQVARCWSTKNFFTYRYDYREEWLRFTNTLGSWHCG